MAFLCVFDRDTKFLGLDVFLLIGLNTTFSKMEIVLANRAGYYIYMDLLTHPRSAGRFIPN